MIKPSTRATNKYNNKTYDRIMLNLPKGYLDKLKNVAGDSISKYIQNLIDIELDNKIKNINTNTSINKDTNTSINKDTRTRKKNVTIEQLQDWSDKQKNKMTYEDIAKLESDGRTATAIKEAVNKARRDKKIDYEKS